MNKNMESIKSGLEKFDEITGGFHNSDLIMIGAHPFADPCYFLISCLKNIVAEKSAKPLYFTLDWNSESIKRTLVSSILGISYCDVKNYSDKIDQIKQTYKEISETVSIIDCACKERFEIEELNQIAADYVENSGCNIIFIDLLSLIKSRQFRDEYDCDYIVVPFIVRELKKLAVKLKVPVVCIYFTLLASQIIYKNLLQSLISETVKKQADTVILIFRHDVWHTKQINNNTLQFHDGWSWDQRQIAVVKNKNGKTGYIDAKYYSKSSGYVEVS